MDEKQTGKMDKNRHFHKYYQRPSYLPRKYFPNSDPNIKRGFWNGLVHFLSYLNVILRSIILLKRSLKGKIIPYLHSGQNLEW